VGPVNRAGEHHMRQPARWRWRLGRPSRPDPNQATGPDRGLEAGWEQAEWSGRVGWLPELVRVTPTRVGVGRDWTATLAVVGYPNEAAPGWLEPLLTYTAAPVDVCLHVDPVPTELAHRQLRRQLARLESGRFHDADHGRLPDPHADAAAHDAHELTARLARADTRLHRLGLYLTVHAAHPDELDEHLTALRALCAQVLCDARPVTYRALQGWTTTLPLGIDALRQRRVMDSDAAATLFPFAGTDLPRPDPASPSLGTGVLYGRNLASGGLVLHDRFAAPNYNTVVLATSGAGKSYLVKLEALRSLYRGVDILVIDPEDEYARLCRAVGGAHLRLGAAGVRVNPLDLPHHHTPTPTAAGGCSPTPCSGCCWAS
jgi:hypothetical protein